MTERPEPSAKAIRDTFEKPTVFGIVEAEPLVPLPVPESAHGLKWLVASVLHLRRTA